jgi:HTH-type transcriptional regulator/antitoxin HigA
MDKHSKLTYQPDYVVASGDVLADELEARGMTQLELAHRTGLTPKHIVSIVKAKAPITPETAIKFERALGLAAEFWLALEAKYQERLARFSDEKRLREDIAWLSDFPVKEMVKIGWVPKSKSTRDQLIEILKFFGIAYAKQWNEIWSSLVTMEGHQACVKRRDVFALSAWLRRGEIESSWVLYETYRRERFRQTLYQVRSLTASGPDVFVPKMMELSAAAGIVVIFVPTLPTHSINGCTRWLSTQKALIQLSSSLKTDHSIWISFLRGAAHVLFQGKKKHFFDVLACQENSEEREVYEFAEQEAIPKKEFSRFIEAGQFSKRSILSFATEIGIGPGIIVGQLQKLKLVPASSHNNLKLEFVRHKEVKMPVENKISTNRLIG